MNLILTAHRDATVDYDGTPIKEFDSKLETPLKPGGINPSINSYCWVLDTNWRGKWIVREDVLQDIVFNGIWNYHFRHGYYTTDLLGKDIFLRDDLTKAKEECIRRNKMQKVKVKYYHG